MNLFTIIMAIIGIIFTAVVCAALIEYVICLTVDFVFDVKTVKHIFIKPKRKNKK